MTEHDFENCRLVTTLLPQELIADLRMGADNGQFVRGQRSRLVQDRERDFGLADVVQQGASDKLHLVARRKAQATRELGGKAGNQQAMLIGRVVMSPDDLEPSTDAAFAYRGHHALGRCFDMPIGGSLAAHGGAEQHAELQ